MIPILEVKPKSHLIGAFMSRMQQKMQPKVEMETRLFGKKDSPLKRKATKACPVNFENENYTIITSQCKGPVYPRDPCCESFLQIACPHWEHVNDEKTNCASTLFSYINLYGKYPPGLFASMCKEGKEGLSCEKVEKSADHNSNNSWATATSAHVLFIVLVVVFVLDLIMIH
uniref:GPI-anchored protein LLG3-like n=1 Tax=Erigeron canadensis TaxID=72917 RepID=UPI001CB9415B|nr:GPI-anchored protein LLG3-like [Erigeron canadensis]